MNMIKGIIKILLSVFLVLLLIYAFVTARDFGHDVFADQAKDSERVCVERQIVITRGESLLKIGEDLYDKHIVKNAFVFAASLRTMEGYDKIVPGVYTVNSSMKPSEILTILKGEGSES